MIIDKKLKHILFAIVPILIIHRYTLIVTGENVGINVRGIHGEEGIGVLSTYHDRNRVLTLIPEDACRFRFIIIISAGHGHQQKWECEQ